MQADVSRCFAKKMLNTGLLFGAQIILDGSVLSREAGQMNEQERRGPDGPRSCFQVVCADPRPVLRDPSSQIRKPRQG